MPPRRSADGYASDGSVQSVQENDAPYVPMGQEDSIAEQSQRRSIASFLGMGDRKEKRRSSTTSETAPDASTTSKSGKGWWSSSRTISAEVEVPVPPTASSRTATLQPRPQATLAPKPAATGDPAVPPLQTSSADANGRESIESPWSQDLLANGGEAGHERPPSARAATDAAQPPGGDASKQKHRRNRSLGSLGGILSLKSRGKDDKGKEQPTTPTGSHPSSPFIQTSGRSETVPVSTLTAPVTITAPAAPARPRTAELRDSQKMSCFGMRSGSKASGTRNNTEEEELSSDEKVVKPRAEPVPDPTVGMVGLKSIDNTTCFVSAAVQCLRHAAELPLLLVPTLESDMLAAQAEQAATGPSTSAPSSANLASSVPPLGTSAPVTPSSSPHSSLTSQQAQHLSSQGRDSGSAASTIQQHDSDMATAGDSPQAPTTPQTSTSRSSAFSALTDQAQPGAEGLDGRGSGREVQPQHSGITPLLPDDSPRTTPPRPDGLPLGPHSIGPRPSMKVDSTLLSSYTRIVTEASLGSRSSMDLCRPLSDFSLEPKPQPPSDNQRAETPAALPIGAPRPSLLKLIAQASKEPAVKGDLGKAVRNLVRELYCAPPNTAADVSELLQAFARLPAGQDFVDGNQHDCQEFLHNLIDALHEDLGTGRRAPRHSSSEPLDEAAKADRSWEEDAAQSDSCVRELLRGQLQSCVVCSKCHVRSTTYEPFWDLSLPLAQPQGKNGSISSWFMLNKTLPASISDCLAAHTGDELLQGDEAFHCDTCACTNPATRTLRFHRLPRVLIMHLKRFGVGTRWNEKVATHITFPVKGLKMGSYMSDERVAAGEEPVYDLFAVSNHYGSPQGGHYTAFCKAPPSSKDRDSAQWLSFNDEVVAKMNTTNVESSCAYMMFYVRRT